MIILPSWLITSAKDKPLQNWGVRIVNNKIDDVAPNAILIERYPTEEKWDANDQIVAPGFVDAHSHLYGVLAHGIPLVKVPAGFMPFLEEFWWPLVENRLDKEMICAATDYNCAEMIQGGITSFYDCEEAPNALPGILAAQAKIVKNRGLRGILSFEATQRINRENGQLGLKENLDFINAPTESENLVKGMMCFHTTFTCDSEFIKQAYSMAESTGSLVHSHCSEGGFEPLYTLKNFGKRPIQYYDELGVLGDRSLLSQCVQIDPSEIDILAKRNVRVTHMPLSNCEVGGGIAPIPDLEKAGVTIGLGSDGYITDFFEVMRGAFLIHKANRLDPQTMPASLVWYMATEGGAKAIGLENVGRLAVGWEADLQMFNWDSPNPLEEHNLFDLTLLYCHQTNMTGVVVSGKVLMKNGILLGVDKSELRRNTYQACKRLWEHV